MGRRTKIRIALFAAALFAVMIMALVSSHTGANQYTTRLDAHSTRAFGEAAGAVSKLEESLEKFPIAQEPPLQTAILSEIYCAAESTETALSMLPVELDALERVAGNINLIGDYAYTALSYTVNGEPIPLDTRKQLASFSEIVSTLSAQLCGLQQAMMDHAVIPEQHELLTDSLHNIEIQSDANARTMDSEFHEIAIKTPNPPLLIYDGKYCSHESDEAQLLMGKDEITQDAAVQIAAELLSARPEALSVTDAVGGHIPCWRIQTVQEPSRITLDISKKGGLLVRLMSESSATLREVPENVIKSLGIQSMKIIESDSTGDISTTVYAPVQDGFLLLSDRIIVQVNRGKVVSIDFTNYLEHHHNRDTDAFQRAIDLHSVIPDGFQIRETQDVVICSPGEQDRFCKMISGTMEDGLQAVIFANLQTGKQEQIMLQSEYDRSF